MKVSVQYAQDHLQELLATAERGEEVEIASDGRASFKLLVMPSPGPVNRREPIILGAGAGELNLPTDEEWRAMKEEEARLMNDAPLMTSG